jgi:protein phosphatase
MAASIVCYNPECQAPNQVSQSVCAHCRFPIPKIYLWVLGDELADIKVGQMLNGRYLLVAKRTLLDTKPALPPDKVDKIPEEITKYLRLLKHKQHIPQVYGRLSINRSGRKTSQLWILENAPIHSSLMAANMNGELMPDIETGWKSAGSMRQLNWLWQIAQLWQPFLDEGCASTLLDPQLLRVDQGIIKILELSIDSNPPQLTELGYLWQKWLKTARIGASQFMDKICQGLISGEIKKADQLIALLDQNLTVGSQRQFLECDYLTLSHTGPTRGQNEDACYPVSGSDMQYRTGYDLTLAIVCDGVGGHQGGEVASNLAIETIRNRLENVLTKPENRNPESTISQIATSVCVANDQISLRNDSESRQERQRMGTTMALTIIQGHEAYVANVGDSRVYRITRSGCQQVTLDDDLATREVRLGYSLYREATATSGSGSLFQALGMTSSTSLHPTVHRMVVDEECIFLLCSDGLSDHGRVDQFWQQDILPVLEGKIDLATAANRLITTANTRNGHDNVTVGLIHCRVKQPRETVSTPVTEQNPTTTALNLAPNSTLLLSGPPVTSELKVSKKPYLWIGAASLAAVLAIGGVVAMRLSPAANNPPPAPASTVAPTPTTNGSGSPAPETDKVPPTPAGTSAPNSPVSTPTSTVAPQ